MVEIVAWHFMKRILCLCLAALLAVVALQARQMSKEELLQALQQNPYRAAAGHNSYEAPEYKDTRAPRGYRPVYVSHYGRHGSRYQGDGKSFEKVLPIMDVLAKDSLLTATGDSLRIELHLMYEAHDDNGGLLTMKGGREQREIAERLYQRVPKVFKQKESTKVSCVSTQAQRCLQSMANFATSVKGCSPRVDVTYDTGAAKLLHYLSPRVSAEDRTFVRSQYEPLQDSLLNISSAPSTAAARLFVDTQKARSYFRNKSEAEFIYELFEAAQGAGCLDIKVNPLRFFTIEELYDFLQIRNLYFCANYGPLASTREMRSKAVIPLLRGIVLEADAALAGNGHCADLRFGHDGGMGPLLTLLGIEGFDKPVDPRNSLEQWQAWRYIPMCTNLQMIFYRNRKGDVLVKFLRNEQETHVPALTPVQSVYYRWQDVRRHILNQTGDYKELPAYYNEYLDGKASEIAELKKNESDAFFFWTDTHYPDNAGNTAAVLEYLQEKIGPTKLFFGGDVALNADRLDPGVSANSSSWMQMCQYGQFFPIRGNHDFMSSTAITVASPETMNNHEVRRYLASFTSPEVVYNPDDALANYYYIDNRKAKIRYVVFDSTDSVKDERVIYGMSDKQRKWIFDGIYAGLPKGWSVMFLSHVPFAKDHVTQPQLLEVGENILQLSRDRNVLLSVCGHRHSDVESGIGTVFQVITAADCLVDMAKIVTPYSVSLPKKEKGTVNEQTIDYVSISKDHTKVTIKRIGYGHDRIFNVKPIFCPVGENLTLKSGLNGPLKWFAYDAEGNSVIPSGDGWHRLFETSCIGLTVSSEGVVTSLSPVPGIVVATDQSGVKEYFMVKSRQ